MCSMASLGINKALEHVVLKLDRDTRHTVREELEEEEHDVLTNTKDTLFNLAREIYEQQLKEEGLIENEQQIRITSQKRQKGNQQQLADDIIDLYEYVRGNLVQFPKGVVTKSSMQKLIIVKTQRDSRVENEDTVIQSAAGNAVDSVFDKAKLIQMFNKMSEQDKQINDLLNKVQEDRQRIETLETELVKISSLLPKQDLAQETEDAAEGGNGTESNEKEEG